MTFSRRFALAVLAPPLAVALPAALLFLTRTARLAGGVSLRVSLVAALGYLAAAAAVALPIARHAERVSADVRAKRDASVSVSTALERTTAFAAALWIGWGLLLALVGAAAYGRSFLGMQYFAEAALIVAAPAMAWTYWAGKAMLLNATADLASVAWRGRTWSVRTKIAIVFIGFFVVSAGALVLVISSRVGAELGDEAAYTIARFGLLIALVTSVIFAVATWFLTRDIIRPLHELVRVAEEMAQGRFDSDPRIFSDDEAGEVAASFAVTRRNVRALIARIGDRGQSVTSGVRRMSSGTDALVENAKAQSGMAMQSTDALSQVQREAQTVTADVEEVSRLTGQSAASATELRASFVGVAGQMDELFRSVEKSSAAATQIDASARETANRASALAAIGSDVLTFVSEMEATTRQLMETARATAELSGQVRENALAGSSSVEATVLGIRNVQESTERTAGAFQALQKSLGQIDQILLFIDEVTNRTNLLSLNAAIIAAQAGGHDYGFSVIADEVRQLADRTRTATKEIAQIVRSVQPVAREAAAAMEDGSRNVERTVHLATTASESLATILESTDRSLDMTRSISSALAEQSRASRYLHDQTAKMSENIGETRRATEGQADATRMLAVEAERVSGIALEVKRGTEEQTSSADAIARAMEEVAEGVASTRDRLHRQLGQAEHVAAASREMLRIAQKNDAIAAQFRDSLQSLLDSGAEFESEVARYRG